VRAVRLEEALGDAVDEGSVEKRRRAEKKLVQCISQLNSVANVKRKGRDDLGAEILFGAQEIMRRCEHNELSGAAADAASTLASDVIASFESVREYLQEVGSCLERVDPHLCNNEGLVARLADWEESWEVGSRYVMQVTTLEAICDLISEVTSLETLAPALITMCEDCDVELFLVLPRIVLLCFLADPDNRRAEIVRGLLPHLFQTKEGGAGKSSKPSDPKLERLLSSFGSVMQVLSTKASAGGSEAAWELVMARAMFGSTEAGDAYADLPLATKKVVEDLMRDVEGMSLQLQRHCPEDWNQFSSVLVQCLLGGKQRDAAPKFEV